MTQNASPERLAGIAALSALLLCALLCFLAEKYLGPTPEAGWFQSPRFAIEAALILLAPLVTGRMVLRYLRARQFLANNELRFQSLYEATPAMLHSIDVAGNIVSVSDKWLQTLGYQRSEVIGRKSSEFLTEASRRYAIDTVLPEFFRSGRCIDIPYQFVTKDGHVLDVLLSATAERDAQGQVLRSLAVVQDVTARKHAEKALAESERRMELALGGADLGLWDLDILSGAVSHNPRLLTMLGYESGEIQATADTLPALLHPEDKTRLKSGFLAHLKGDTASFEAEYRLRHKDDHWIWVLTRGKVVERDEAGRALRMTGTNLDITERKQNEAALKTRETRLATLIASMQDTVFVTDTCGKVVEYFEPSSSLRPAFQTRESVLCKPFAEFFPEPVARLFDDAFVSIIEDGNPRMFEYSLSLRGQNRVSQATTSPLLDDARYPTGFLTVVRDITAERSAQEERERLTRRNTLLLESVGEGVFGVDLEYRATFVNSAALAMLGFTEAEICGQNQHALFHHHHPDGSVYEASECPVRLTLEDGRIRREENEWFWRKDGSRFPVAMTVTPVVENGRQSGVVVVFQDISERKQQEAKIYHLAFYDPLTRLPNRRLLLDRLEHAQAAGDHRHSHGAIVFLDLDNFKILNDTKGHEFGDLLLVEAARRLLACVRAEDTVARLGGDEFVVVLEDLNQDEGEAMTEALSVGKKICAALGSPYDLQDYVHHSSASIGICLFRGTEIAPGKLLKQADMAMYEAKSAGRNTIRVYREPGR